VINGHVVLVEPVIPGNSGSLARVCAGTRSALHLVEPLGFALDDRHLKRAGLDYWPNVMWQTHPSLEDALTGVSRDEIFLFSARAPRVYSEPSYPSAPYLVFGTEPTGFSETIRENYADRMFRVPVTGEIRSLNLATVATLVLYEVLRQNNFPSIEATD